MNCDSMAFPSQINLLSLYTGPEVLTYTLQLLLQLYILKEELPSLKKDFFFQGFEVQCRYVLRLFRG